MTVLLFACYKKRTEYWSGGGGFTAHASVGRPPTKSDAAHTHSTLTRALPHLSMTPAFAAGVHAHMEAALGLGPKKTWKLFLRVPQRRTKGEHKKVEKINAIARSRSCLPARGRAASAAVQSSRPRKGGGESIADGGHRVCAPRCPPLRFLFLLTLAFVFSSALHSGWDNMQNFAFSAEYYTTFISNWTKVF